MAGGAKDLEFVREAIAHDLVRREVLQERLGVLPIPQGERARIASVIENAPWSDA